MVRVIVVDDHQPFLDVARELMDATPGFESVGGASSAEAGLRVIESQRPDLALIDIHMRGMDGIEMCRRINRSADAPLVVLISAQDTAQLPAAACRCGAAEVIGKDELRPARLERLWRTHAGGGDACDRT